MTHAPKLHRNDFFIQHWSNVSMDRGSVWTADRVYRLFRAKPPNVVEVVTINMLMNISCR